MKIFFSFYSVLNTVFFLNKVLYFKVQYFKYTNVFHVYVIKVEQSEVLIKSPTITQF